MKALVTGASSTSGGAFVVNDRYGPTIDLVGERELTVYDLVTKGFHDQRHRRVRPGHQQDQQRGPVAEATTAAAPTAPGTAGALVLAAGGRYKTGIRAGPRVVSTTVKTIAHWLPITKRAASDAGQIRTLIDNFLRYGLNEELEDQMLTGSGSGENFTGPS